MSDVNDIKNDAKEMYKDVKASASSTYDTAKNAAEETLNQVKEKTSALYEESKKKANLIQDSWCEHQDELIKLIKDKPLSSVLIAAGAGYLFSKIFSK